MNLLEKIREQKNTNLLQKTFNHLSLDINYPLITSEEVILKNNSIGRGYRYNDKLYPSATTVLAYHNHEDIDAWKEAVGKEQAAFQTKLATIKGTKFHSNIEDYLNNKKVIFDNIILERCFKIVKNDLDRIDNIIGQEVPLISKKYKVAGRCDCIGDFDKVRSIIDFKTSSKRRTKEDIINYFVQTFMYAEMFYEITGIDITNLVIIMSVNEDVSLVFVEEKSKYEQIAKEVRFDFYKKENW